MSKIPDDPDQVVDYNPLDNTSKSILPFFNFEIASTPNCNMACTYCFEGDELKSKAKQKQENIPKIVQKIKELLTSESFTKEYSGIVLNFWGGEPTINFNWNKDLITAIRQERINGKPLNVRYFIYTNGYSYTKVTQHLDLFTKREIKDQIIRIQISWDGIEGLRVDHSGKQTLNIIRENIKKIAKNYPDLNASTKATIQPEELMKDLEKYIEYRNILDRTYFIWNLKEELLDKLKELAKYQAQSATSIHLININRQDKTHSFGLERNVLSFIDENEHEHILDLDFKKETSVETDLILHNELKEVFEREFKDEQGLNRKYSEFMDSVDILFNEEESTKTQTKTQIETQTIQEANATILNFCTILIIFLIKISEHHRKKEMDQLVKEFTTKVNTLNMTL